MKTRNIPKKSAVCGLRSAVSGRRAASAGFTLIELMVVILVILLLSGLLFRLGAIIKDRSERAKATADLANIEHALNEYFAEYGIYPPVKTTAYVYEDTSLQPPVMDQGGVTNEIGWEYGLVAHLYKRDMANPSPHRMDQYNADTERDIAAKERWYHYLADVNLSSSAASNSIPGDVTKIYSNGVATITDPWGGEYKYVSKPPYLSYELKSNNLD